MNRQRVSCFTGHRDIPNAVLPLLIKRLDETIAELIAHDMVYFGAGGALGFDTLAAEAVLRAREKHPHIKLILVLPYPEQSERWSKAQQRTYEIIKQKADKVKYTSDRYTTDCFHIRNKALVDGAGLCVAYKYKDGGGTAFTCQYAKEQGVRVINIAEGLQE